MLGSDGRPAADKPQLTTFARNMAKKPHRDDHLFVAFNRHVCALHKQTGEVVWHWRAPHAGYMTLLCEQDRLFVAVNGYMYALDPGTGEMLWNNDMKGFGMGVTSLATLGQASPTNLLAAAAAAEDSRRRATT